jgi:hypothetical protein
LGISNCIVPATLAHNFLGNDKAVAGSRLQVQGSRLQVQGSRLGSWNLEPATAYFHRYRCRRDVTCSKNKVPRRDRNLKNIRDAMNFHTQTLLY